MRLIADKEQELDAWHEATSTGGSAYTQEDLQASEAKHVVMARYKLPISNRRITTRMAQKVEVVDASPPTPPKEPTPLHAAEAGVSFEP